VGVWGGVRAGSVRFLVYYMDGWLTRPYGYALVVCGVVSVCSVWGEVRTDEMVYQSMELVSCVPPALRPSWE
jgi:hypothetical protein